MTTSILELATPFTHCRPATVVVNYRSGPFYYHAGVWYRPARTGFVVVTPPIGIVVPILPPAYATIYTAGVPELLPMSHLKRRVNWSGQRGTPTRTWAV